MTDEEMYQMTQEELIALAKQQGSKERMPCIIRDAHLPLDAPPAHVRTMRAKDLSDIRPGETFRDALERKAVEVSAGHGN